MLRITINHEAMATRFIVEGSLAGPPVEELKTCWQKVANANPGLPLLVDLSAMTRIDSEGIILLTELHRQGVQFAAAGLMTQAIIKEITG